VRDKLFLDLSVDPPPDLAIEIEIASSAENRMRVYAGLRVPEVWRFDGQTLSVNQLVANGEYVVVERSRFFPFLRMSELVRFLHLRGQINETEHMEMFLNWVRQQIATGWSEPSGS
jgi:Uma2 family endonuclease